VWCFRAQHESGRMPPVSPISTKRGSTVDIDLLATGGSFVRTVAVALFQTVCGCWRDCIVTVCCVIAARRMVPRAPDQDRVFNQWSSTPMPSLLGPSSPPAR
jgi:hypothetical protein